MPLAAQLLMWVTQELNALVPVLCLHRRRIRRPSGPSDLYYVHDFAVTVSDPSLRRVRDDREVHDREWQCQRVQPVRLFDPITLMAVL